VQRHCWLPWMFSGRGRTYHDGNSATNLMASIRQWYAMHYEFLQKNKGLITEACCLFSVCLLILTRSFHGLLWAHAMNQYMSLNFRVGKAEIKHTNIFARLGNRISIKTQVKAATLVTVGTVVCSPLPSMPYGATRQMLLWHTPTRLMSAR
jgi:hypothetical protein